MRKRIISTLLTIAMLAALLPTAFAADTVTRAEWISQLVAAFSMTVEDDTTMPDNYFSDITESDSYYRDILLAVEFGVIDLDAGEAFEPNESATREFAARTLNSCLQFQLDEDAEYTFNEAESVTYPDDIQVAVNRNWFALSGGNFLPEQAITSAEATAMLADAKSVIDSEAIDENYNSQFEFAEGVIVIPETAQTSIDENNTVTITDNETEINVDDIFVVFSSGIPIALKATAVETTDNITVISATKEGAENAILSVDYESVSEVDLENFVADEVETYSITNTSTDETEEIEIQLYSIDYDDKTKTLKASKNIKVGGGLAGSISVEVKNIKLHQKENVKKGIYQAYITGNTTITESISFDFGEYAGIPHSILLGIIPVEGIGDVSLELDISLEGGMTCTEIGEVKSGFCYERYEGFRLIANYTKKEFSYTAEVNLKVGLTLSANVSLIFVSGRAWATIGVHGYYKKHRYNDGMPLLCETVGAYLYANYGAKVTITGQDANIFDKKVDIWTEENSPVRVYYHYESGARVDACTRDAENTDARVKYTTSTNSAYFNPSPNRAQGSYSGDSGGSTAEPVVIWEYEVDDNGNATITGYKGNASAVAIPSKIDGYTVTKIGSSAFENNKILRSVSMPDSVTEIGESSFANCSSLKEIQIPDTIITLGRSTFSGCSSLQNITFSKNISKLPNYIFENCSSLTEVTIPDNITSMGESVFFGCTNLKTVKIPDTINTIPSSTFYNCTSLTDVSIPNTVTKINSSAFYGCSLLENIELPSSLNTIGNSVFENCSNLKSIDVPDSVTSFGSSVFKNCDALTDVTLDIKASIGSEVFYNCDALQKVTINATSIGSKALYNLDALTSVTFGDKVTSIGSELCYGCENLTDINFGKYITEIPASSFRQCQRLTSVNLPRFCTKVSANAFAEDTKLTSAYVPVSVASIENNSFSYPAKMTMYGKSGSYAEEYANSRNMPFSATNAPITKIDYTDNSIDIGRYAKIRPTLNIEPEFDTSVVTFASSDENILTVSETGEIYGKNYGTATITATSDSGVKDTITVNVVRLADSVSLDKTELELETGDTAKLKATLNPSDATDQITWKSSNENVATVSGGTVTAVGAGTAVITVTTTGGKTASCTVKVIGTFTVTATAGENGTISPSGDVAVKSNEKKTFNILPDYGYVVKDVLVNGASVGAVETYTFSNLTDNATITAEFAKVYVTYEDNTITISSEAALKDLKLIIATYDDEGRLTDCDIKTVSAAASAEYQESISMTDNTKIMLWNGLDNMRPVWCNK